MLTVMKGLKKWGKWLMENSTFLTLPLWVLKTPMVIGYGNRS